jgi:hypothetical protein
MHMDDAGVGSGKGHLVHVVCGKCGHDGGWWKVANVTEGRRGIPCPVCNPDKEGQK